MLVNPKLKEYIEGNIFPEYNKNDAGHRLDHIEYVIERCFLFAKEVTDEDINFDMLFTIAAYHDVGHHIDAKNHEKVSSDILRNDENLKAFFSDEQIEVMAEAIEDHRASLKDEPRSIYGKIVSSADRNTILEMPLKRTYAYRVNQMAEASLLDIIAESKKHLIEKFGSKGYATEKMYFEDLAYKEYLETLQELLKNAEEFQDRYIAVNHLEKRFIREQLLAYEPFNEQEVKDKELFLEFLSTFPDVLTRDNHFGHITASSFVVNEDFSQAILLDHILYSGKLYPGGHADGDYNLLRVAHKENSEEIGVETYPYNNGELFAIQANPTKGHVRKGIYVPAHTHYDFLYLFVVKNTDMANIRIEKGGSNGINWYPLDETYSDIAVDWIRPVNEKIVKKIRSLKR